MDIGDEKRAVAESVVWHLQAQVPLRIYPKLSSRSNHQGSVAPFQDILFTVQVRGDTMKFSLFGSFTLFALVCTAHAGQPIERFRGIDHLTFSQGSSESRYGNADSNVKITMQLFILGQQVYNTPSSTPESAYAKMPGTLDFSLKLSDFDPTLPPDTVTLTGADLGGDLMQHTVDTVLPGPYHIVGNYNGIDVDITLSNVHVTGTLRSQGSNTVTLPEINPVLGEYIDVQFDDPAGFNNNLVAVPGQVSGWAVSPIFTVQSLRVDVTGIQQAIQALAHIVSPSAFTVTFGKKDTGDATSLAAFDGVPLRVCRFLVPNVQVAPVTVEVTGTAPGVPGYISLLSRSRMSTSGVFMQSLDMFDFAGTGYTSGDTRSDSITTAYSTRVLNGTGAASRYVGSGNALKARYRVRPTGVVSSSSWCADHDVVGWIVTP